MSSDKVIDDLSGRDSTSKYSTNDTWYCTHDKDLIWGNRICRLGSAERAADVQNPSGCAQCRFSTGSKRMHSSGRGTDSR
jgi:hypothetical protein